MKVYIFKN